MKVKLEHMMDAGCAGRKNQDAYWFKKQLIQNQQVILGVVCDGVGGVSDGEIASRSTIECIVDDFWSELPHYLERKVSIKQIGEQLEIILQKLNQRMYLESKKKGKRTGTTIALALVLQKEYFICNVGDSRVYWNKKKGVYRTKDHTIASKNPENHDLEDDHILWQSIGSQKELWIDKHYGETEIPMDILLVTDGAYRSFQKKEIMEYCRKGNLRKMRRQAIKRREADNMTAVRIELR